MTFTAQPTVPEFPATARHSVLSPPITPSARRRDYLKTRRWVCKLAAALYDSAPLVASTTQAVRLALTEVPESCEGVSDLRGMLEIDIRTALLNGATLADVIAACDAELEAVQ